MRKHIRTNSVSPSQSGGYTRRRLLAAPGLIVDGPSKREGCLSCSSLTLPLRDYRRGFVRPGPRNCPGVSDTRAQQGIAGKEAIEAQPREAHSARPASQPLTPDAADRVDELLRTAIVRRRPEALVVATQFRVEHLLPVFRWRVQMRSTPGGDSDDHAPQASPSCSHASRTCESG